MYVFFITIFGIKNWPRPLTEMLPCDLKYIHVISCSTCFAFEKNHQRLGCERDNRLLDTRCTPWNKEYKAILRRQTFVSDKISRSPYVKLPEVSSAHLNFSGLQRSPSWKKVLVSLLTQSSSWQESTTLNWGAFPVVRDIEADKEEYKAKICRAADMIGIKRRGFFFVTFLHTSLMLMMKALFFVEQNLFRWHFTKRP